VTTRDRDYQMMLTALADVARRRDEELSTTEQQYQDNAALAAGELARAEGEAAAADRWAGAAASQVIDVDKEAEQLWHRLSQTRGVRRQLGELPAPAAIESLPRAQIEGARPAPEVPRQSPRVLLARAGDRIEVKARPAPRRPLPRWTLPLLPVVGALLATAVGLVAAGLVTFGERPFTGSAMVRLAGWLTFLLAPSAGVPVAAFLAHRRDSRLDIGGVGLTLIGGMVAAALLSLSFASAR
jgi:hypothetical protein